MNRQIVVPFAFSDRIRGSTRHTCIDRAIANTYRTTLRYMPATPPPPPVARSGPPRRITSRAQEFDPAVGDTVVGGLEGDGDGDVAPSPLNLYGRHFVHYVNQTVGSSGDSSRSSTWRYEPRPRRARRRPPLTRTEP